MTMPVGGAAPEWRNNWRVVVAATAGMSMTVLYLYSFGAIVEPIEQEMHWSRAQASSGITVVALVGALIGPFSGVVVDRYGARRTAIIAVPLFAGAFALISLANADPRIWWLLWGLLAPCAVFAGPQLWTSSVAALFTSGRGFALAVALCGTSIGATLIPIITEHLVASVGWRTAIVCLSLCWCGACYLLALGLPRQAERRVKPAGLPAASDPGAPRLIVAILSRRFLSIASAATMFSLATIPLILSVIPLLTSRDIPAPMAAKIAALVGLTAIVGRLSSGWLVDRIDSRIVACTCLSLPAVAATLLLAVPGSATVAAAAILILGLALGAELDTVALFVSRYLDLRLYGALFGTLVSCLSVATALGPLAAGAIFDATQSYDWVLRLMIPLSLGAAALIASLGPVPASSE